MERHGPPLLLTIPSHLSVCASAREESIAQICLADDYDDTGRNNITDSDEKKYYPVVSEENKENAKLANLAIDPSELSDNILDSWDSSSDEFLSNDQFINELQKEKLEKNQLEELLGTDTVIDDSENFPLQGFPDKTSNTPPVKTVSKQAPGEVDDDSSINPEKLAYILIGVTIRCSP